MAFEYCFHKVMSHLIPANLLHDVSKVRNFPPKKTASHADLFTSLTGPHAQRQLSKACMGFDQGSLRTFSSIFQALVWSTQCLTIKQGSGRKEQGSLSLMDSRAATAGVSTEWWDQAVAQHKLLWRWYSSSEKHQYRESHGPTHFNDCFNHTRQCFCVGQCDSCCLGYNL